jgi:hypothetical protein
MRARATAAMTVRRTFLTDIRGGSAETSGFAHGRQRARPSASARATTISHIETDI